MLRHSLAQRPENHAALECKHEFVSSNSDLNQTWVSLSDILWTTIHIITVIIHIISKAFFTQITSEKSQRLHKKCAEFFILNSYVVAALLLYYFP